MQRLNLRRVHHECLAVRKSRRETGGFDNVTRQCFAGSRSQSHDGVNRPHRDPVSFFETANVFRVNTAGTWCEHQLDSVGTSISSEAHRTFDGKTRKRSGREYEFHQRFTRQPGMFRLISLVDRRYTRIVLNLSESSIPLANRHPGRTPRCLPASPATGLALTYRGYRVRDCAQNRVLRGNRKLH